MARYIARVESPKPADEVFAYLTDFRNFADWDPGVSRSEQVAGDGPGLDAAYDVTVDNGRTMTLRYEVVAFEAPRMAKVVAKASWFASIDIVEVHETATGSEAVYDATLQLPWYLRFGDPLLRRVFNRIGAEAGAGLERALDGTLVA